MAASTSLAAPRRPGGLRKAPGRQSMPHLGFKMLRPFVFGSNEVAYLDLHKIILDCSQRRDQTGSAAGPVALCNHNACRPPGRGRQGYGGIQVIWFTWLLTYILPKIDVVITLSW